VTKATILKTMSDLAHKRAEKMQSLPTVKFPPLTDLKTLTWLGTFSWSNQANKSRFLVANVVVDLFGVPQVPPELARDYLRAKYTEFRHHTIQQYGAINEKRSAPLYCKRGFYPDMAYVDLRAAYWSILQIVGWDVDYNPGRWLGKRSDVDDFPLPDNKLARNSLVSTGLITQQQIWTGDKIKRIKAHNPLVNYDIWALAQDVLHSIGQIALRAGACHIHTDGYIVPARMAAHLIEEIRNWGLPATIKYTGDATIYGIGAYDIGEHISAHKPHFRTADFSNLYEPDISFLRPRMRKFSRTRIDW